MAPRAYAALIAAVAAAEVRGHIAQIGHRHGAVAGDVHGAQERGVRHAAQRSFTSCSGVVLQVAACGS